MCVKNKDGGLNQPAIKEFLDLHERELEYVDPAAVRENHEEVPNRNPEQPQQKHLYSPLGLETVLFP